MGKHKNNHKKYKIHTFHIVAQKMYAKKQTCLSSMKTSAINGQKQQQAVHDPDKPGKYKTALCKKCILLFYRNERVDHCLLIDIGHIVRSSVRIDESGNSRICTSGNPDPVFNGTKNSNTSMLKRPGSFPKPAVIGDDNEKLSPLSDKFSHQIGKYRFITNHYRKTNRLFQ